jgi:multimeric flavodoxin WrbA
MRVVAFNGSPRPDGNTALALRGVLGELDSAGVDTELVQVGGKHLHGCRACGRCRKNQDRRCSIEDDMLNDCISKMIEAQGMVIGSPTHFADLTPDAKALIDRAGYVARANGDMFRRKVGAAVVAVRRAGALHVFDSINHLFTISQMIVCGSSYWNLVVGGAAGEAAEDEEGMETMRVLGRNMAWLLEKLY